MRLPTLEQPGDNTLCGYRDLDPVTAVTHLPQLRVIDVREHHEFTGPLGHIEGAELVPMGRIGEASPGWDKDTPILLICRSGARSASVAQALAGLGFGKLYNLAGGMLAWETQGLPRTFSQPGTR